MAVSPGAPAPKPAHKMCFMSGRLDPTRLSTKNYSTSALDSWMLMITKGHVGEEWGFGRLPYTRKNPPPKVRSSCPFP